MEIGWQTTSLKQKDKPFTHHLNDDDLELKVYARARQKFHQSRFGTVKNRVAATPSFAINIVVALIAVVLMDFFWYK